MISSDKVDWLVLSLSYWDFYLSSHGGTCGDPSVAIRMNECDYGSSVLGKVLIPRAEAQLKGYAELPSYRSFDFEGDYFQYRSLLEGRIVSPEINSGGDCGFAIWPCYLT